MGTPRLAATPGAAPLSLDRMVDCLGGFHVAIQRAGTNEGEVSLPHGIGKQVESNLVTRPVPIRHQKFEGVNGNL
jgi:hypothetical protein